MWKIEKISKERELRDRERGKRVGGSLGGKNAEKTETYDFDRKLRGLIFDVINYYFFIVRHLHI